MAKSFNENLMAELFQTTPQNITLHLKNIFEEGELEQKATCKDFLIVQNEGELLPEATIRKFRIVQKERKSNPTRLSSLQAEPVNSCEK